MRNQEVLSVVISILIIITIAVVQRYSKLVAAITATMPLTAALGYWVVTAAAPGDQTAATDFSRGMLITMVPTLVFLLVLWLASRGGIQPGWALGLGYAAWALGTLLLVFVRRQILGGA